MRKIAVGQAGGPTAVFNASLVGLMESLYEDATLFTVTNGYQGLVQDDMEQVDGALYEWVRRHRRVPGACLGSGRYPFTPERMARAVANLQKRDIHTLVLIGGNGTMAGLQRMSEIARSMNYELQVVGIPTTVDNDLAGTDHAPGFASAARYAAMSVRDIGKDLEAMRNFEQVRIIETMGRNAGWLALASGYLKASELDGPHFIYLPEVKVSREQFLTNVRDCVRELGMATVVVSEGFAFSGSNVVMRGVVHNRAVLGGIAAEMGRLVRDELGLIARWENMGMNQRSCCAAVSAQDRLEAYEVGKKAAEYVRDGRSGVMVSIQRTEAIGYNYELIDKPVEEVAQAGERLLPHDFIENRTKFYSWLEPIIGEDMVKYPPMRRVKQA